MAGGQDRDLDLGAPDVRQPLSLEAFPVGLEAGLAAEAKRWPKPGMGDVSLVMPADDDVAGLMKRASRAPDFGRDGAELAISSHVWRFSDFFALCCGFGNTSHASDATHRELCCSAFSSREPVSTSLENASAPPGRDRHV
jgi:hypothetical protein